MTQSDSGYRRLVQEDEANAYPVVLAAYAAVNLTAAALLRRRGRRLAVPTVSDVLLVGVATFKLSRLLTKEKVAAPLREPFVEEVEPGTGTELNSTPVQGGVRGAVAELITCPFCLSVWIATAFMTAHAVAPRAVRLVAAGASAAAVADVAQYGFARVRQGVD